MSFFRRHRNLICFVCLMLLSIVGLCYGTLEENILALVPNKIKQQVLLFEHSPLSQKLIVITQAPSKEQAHEISTTLQKELTHAGFIVPQKPLTDTIILDMLSALPDLFSQKIQQQTAQKLSSKALAEQFTQYYEDLFSFQSIFTTQKMTQDPFNLTQLLFDRWAALGKGIQTLDYTDGFLTNQDGNLRAGLYDATSAVSDIKTAQQLHQFFNHFQSSLPKDVHAFFVGGLRYTFENVQLIKRDLMIVTLAGLICLFGVFVCFFRTKRALLIYLLPLLVLSPAAWITQLIFGHISGITLGFGSVVVGLSVDYAIYIYFALAQANQQATHVASKITKHLWCNFLTSGLCFVALLFSSIEVFKQIAVFALIALSLAFFISVRILPAYFKTQAFNRLKTSQIEVPFLSFKGAIWACILLAGFGIWGINHLLFSSNLDDLNSTSSVFVKDKQIAEQLFPATRGALLFSLGKTIDQALANNEQISSKVPNGLPISELFISSQTRAENRARWTSFWTAARQSQIQTLLETEAKKAGLNSQAFAPFLTWLQFASTHTNVDFSAWYNPLIKISDNLYAITNVVPNDPLYAQLADQVHSVFISAAELQANLTQGVKKEALEIVGLALLFNLCAVWLLFKNLKETLLCFLPVLLGGSFLFGCLALFQVPVNLFGLIFLPLLIGLGLDYSIFQLIKFRSVNEDLQQLYPTRALLAAGFSTLAGFGVLILAKHAVLFMIGICALIGIGGAVLVSLLILPALWKRCV